jgi:hypothetical protein
MGDMLITVLKYICIVIGAITIMTTVMVFLNSMIEFGRSLLPGVFS